VTGPHGAGAIAWLAGAAAWSSTALFGHVQIGDQSAAAIIAAVASTANAYILLRARRTQREIHQDVNRVCSDTDARAVQIEELRSLSVERNRHILRLERISERLEAVDFEALNAIAESASRRGGRRRYDPPAERGR
jgi:hypothetical protein